MIAAWMIYTVAVGFLLYAAAMGAEFVARALRLPTRFAWVFAMTAALALSGGALFPRGAASHSALTTVNLPRSNQPNAVAPLGDHPTTLGSGAIQSSTMRFETIARSVGGSVSRIDVSAYDRWNNLLIVAWSVSSALMMAWMLVSLLRLRRLARRFSPGTVANRAVLVSGDVGPALLGILRTRIVLPQWVLELRPAEQQIILEHEREHAAAFDPALVCAGMCLVAIQPWNVALWVLLPRLRLAVEADCDWRVVGEAGDARAYGRLLVAMYERTSGLSPHVAFAERASNLERRIRRIASRPRLFSAAGVGSGVAAMVLAIAAWKTPAPRHSSTLMSPPSEPSALAASARASTPPSSAEPAAQRFVAESAHEEPEGPSRSQPSLPELPTVTFRQIVIGASDSIGVVRAARLADSVAGLLRNGAAFDSLAKRYHDYALGEETNVLAPWPLDSLPSYYQKAFGDAKAGDVVSFQVPGLQRPRFVVAQLLTVTERELRPASAPGPTFAQGARPIRLTMESPTNAEYRLVVQGDSTSCRRAPASTACTKRPLLLRGLTTIHWWTSVGPSDARIMEITSLDTTAQVHVEASQYDRVISSGQGSYLILRRDSVGLAIEAWSHVPPSSSRKLGEPSRSSISNVQIDAGTAAVVVNEERRAVAPTGPCAMPDSIAIRGLSRLRDADVRAVLGITPKTPLSGPAVSKALENLYATTSFEPGANATCEIIGGKAVFVFTVTERPRSANIDGLNSPLDSSSARLVELELQRISSSTDAVSLRRLDSQIAALHDRLRSSPGGVVADRNATARVLLALEARASAVRSWLRDARLVYTDAYGPVRNAVAEDRAIGERLAEIRRTM
jgi:hypothetical protein